jgi:Leucine-rich repeat (LRR) protein
MKLLLLLLALPIIGFGQNVNIPDANFKAYLVGDIAINTNGDNEIQVSEASTFNGTISLTQGPGGSFMSGLNITDLTGIEAFVSLTGLICANNPLTSLDVSACSALSWLDCSWNPLTSLDVSANTALTSLYCYGNLLTSLDVSANTALTSLYCYGNFLTSLDVSANTALTSLNCQFNQLNSLDVSTCSALTTLYCYDNQLTSLDVKNINNINMDFFRANNNPNLSCIEVDDVAWSTANWLLIDTTASFSLNCSGAGILDINESNTLMIYPNPTNGDFTITGLELGEYYNVSSLSLTDMNGKVVKVLDTKATKFSMASIKPGVYFLNIISGNKQEVLKIVKE